MSRTKEEHALFCINEAWDDLCPKLDEGFVWRLVSEMMADGTQDQREQARSAISRLYDGLTYGNWPSVIPPVASGLRLEDDS